MKTRCVLVAAALLAVPAVSLAQWSDNFDSYPSGVSMNGLGGWAGWDNTASAAGMTSSAVALSAPNSIAIDPAADAVRSYNVTDGVWTYSAMQYIPGNFTGATYFIMLNTYNHGGPYDWSVQLKFDSATGLVTDDNHAGNTVNFVRDAWAEVRLEIDLDADAVAIFYNGQPLASGAWTSSVNSVTSIGAVDLFGNTGSVVYYDNMNLRQVPAPAAAALLGFAGLFAGRRRR